MVEPKHMKTRQEE